MLIAGFIQQHLFKIIGGVVIALVVASAVGYYYWSKAEIKNLRENQAKLEVTVSQQYDTIAQLQSDFEVAAEQLKKIITKNAEYNQQLIDLINKFQKNGRDLTKLAHEKPKLIENIINEATAKKFDCIEAITRGEKC